MTRLHWIAVGGLAGGLALVLGLGWQFLLKPLGEERQAKLAQLQELQAQLENTKKRAAQFEKFKAEAENVRRDLDFFTRRLDPDLSTAELYTLIDSLGRSLSLKDWRFEAGPREKTKIGGLNLDEVEVKMSFTGDFEKLARLVNLSITQVRIFSPELMRLNRIDDGTGAFVDTLAANLTFKVFVSPEEKAP